MGLLWKRERSLIKSSRISVDFYAEMEKVCDDEFWAKIFLSLVKKYWLSGKTLLRIYEKLNLFRIHPMDSVF